MTNTYYVLSSSQVLSHLALVTTLPARATVICDSPRITARGTQTRWSGSQCPLLIHPYTVRLSAMLTEGAPTERRTLGHSSPSTTMLSTL